MSAKDDLNIIFSEIVNSVDDLRRSKRMRELGNYSIKLIQDRTRYRSSGVKKPGANSSRLKALAPSTIKKRTYLQKLLHPATSPGKSNLTFTGQLLDSMKLKITKEGEVSFGPRGPRRSIYGGRDRVTNEQVAFFVSVDRPFNHLSRGEMTKTVQFYQRTFDTILNSRGLT